MTSNSKFAVRGPRLQNPRVCKAVGDSFRFVTIPFKPQMSWWTNGTIETSEDFWELNGTGSLSQLGNPLQIWSGTIGDLTADNAVLRLTYDTIVNVLSVLYIARRGLLPILSRQRTIANIDLDQPFETLILEMPPSADGILILVQILY